MEKKPQEYSIEADVRKGPWTTEEDLILINHIANHGEGLWNAVAVSAGLKRTGKSCRLRWLNYLRPDVRRGNITPEENLLIMELHAKWGNRWSKIAKQLPGRTDNEIKNYWRTRIQKHIKQEEKLNGQFGNSEPNNQATSSQIGAINGIDETYYSPQLIFPGNLEAFQSPNFLFESNESIWSMEDLGLCNYLMGTN